MSDSDRVRISWLLDFYGPLLTERQRQVTELTFNEDLSLAEISELTGITRQGVRDAVLKAETALLDFEERLGMCRAWQERRKNCAELAEAARRNILDERELERFLEVIGRIEE